MSALRTWTENFPRFLRRERRLFLPHGPQTHARRGHVRAHGQGNRQWYLGVAVADVNGDTKLDVVAANANSDDISVLLGDGAGGLATAVNYPVGDAPRDIAIGDLDGDGSRTSSR